jgi:3-oxoacyl-(acyl-carrier-protein) synthase
MRRVAITGLGVLAPNGTDPKQYAEALWAGQGAVDRIRSFDPSPFASRIAGEVPDVDLPGRPGPPPPARRRSPTAIPATPASPWKRPGRRSRPPASTGAPSTPRARVS